MNFSPGVCPKCREYIFLKEGVPLLTCPLCDSSISAYESGKLFEAVITNPQQVSNVIAACLKIDEEYGPEMALAILDNLADNFPKNEEVVYLCVKMSDFETFRVRAYLERFAHVKKQVPFASVFLENALAFKNLALEDAFVMYIENKLPEKEHSKWRQKVVDMHEIYNESSHCPAARISLYIYYVVCALINVTATIVFFATDINFLPSLGIVVGLFFIEIGTLFLHHKKFGDRFDISATERLLMVIFMCSIVVVMGGMFIGAMV